MSIRPCHGTTWAKRCRPDRLPAAYRRTHGIRYFHGCYSLGDDLLWGITHAAALPHVRGSPALGVLRRLRPVCAFGRRRAYPHPNPSGRRAAGERTQTVPTFAVVRSTG
ncbi:hypothetical protein GCM10023074_27380 [Microbispora amethystogenes]|uniref:Uncharacterized protein n=1 Tax=Microbispora amethystogenes TaxID=1427754 RepID=A0ABQ4F9L5_9ACTN|nr:hypothetical protein Mam01_16850 [Microbispora amethystogenes]